MCVCMYVILLVPICQCCYGSPPPIHPQGKVMGVFQKDLSDFTGDFIDGWKKAVGGTKMKQVSKGTYIQSYCMEF